MANPAPHSQRLGVRGPGNPLPWQLTSLIGRERDLAALRQQLAVTRLLTLTGPGGSGKTRLAAHLAAEFRAAPDAFPDGVWWVDLAALTDAALVPQAVASALEVREQPGRSLVETLADHLAEHQALLVFDNCEHLIAASADLAYHLLGTCPALRLLATSREPLALLGENVWPVPPLDLPDPDADPARLLEYGAVRLFVERARQALPTFALTASNAAAVVGICRRLDGIPLALELAAAGVRSLGVVQMAARLDDMFGLLAGAPRHLPARHQTLRATIDWSYNLLAPQEQRLFRRLAVFAGGFTLAAVEAVCADMIAGDPDSIAPTDIVGLMTRLVDKSLVVVHQGDGLETRYRLLDTVRQYACHRLDDAAPGVRQRHLAWAAALAQEAEPELHGPDIRAWLMRLEREHDNVRAALGWGLGHREETGAAPAASVLDAVRLVGSLGWFWALRGALSEGRRWVEAALQALPAPEMPPSTPMHSGAGTSPLPAPPDVLRQARAGALYAGGILAAAQGDVLAAAAFLQDSLTLGWELGDAGVIGRALLTMGVGVLWQGQTDAARGLLEQSLTHLRQADDRWGQAAALAWLGEVSRGEERFAEAGRAYAESLRLFQSLGDPWGECWPLVGQAHLALQQGDLTTADALYGRCLPVFREFGERWGLGAALNGLAEVARRHGRVDEAVMLYQSALDVHRAIGFQVGAALSLAGLALCAAPDRADQAARWLDESSALLRGARAQLDPTRREAVAHLTAHLQGVGTRAEGVEISEDGLGIRHAGWTTSDQAQNLASSIPNPQSLIPARLRLLALGPVKVYREGQALSGSDWTYAKPRELLFYLLDHGRQTKEQIGLALWPDASAAQLRSNFRTALYHLRRALGDAEWIRFEDDHYSFNRDLDYWYDVEVFERGLKAAQASGVRATEDRVKALTALVGLYRGDFLADVEAGDWVDLRREVLRQAYLAALLALGAAQAAQGGYADATATYRRAIVQDSYLEAAHRELMRCLARQGEVGQALRHYQGLVRLLDDELGALPASETQALHEQLRRGETTL